MVDKLFWRNKKVFVTGHTGFKGSWLCLWLHSLGAKVTGYSLEPPTEISLYSLCNIESMIKSIIGDIRDEEKLRQSIFEVCPEIVIHMAAQPIVRESYRVPVETYEINVMGTVYLLDAIKQINQKGNYVKAVINVTTDKCYENKEWLWGYRENDVLGGNDPYSNSKACSELITACYMKTFFHTKDGKNHTIGIASARAGNVIGGGDWAVDRLVPDCIRSIETNKPITIRNPQSIRPWQHVLEALSGYMLLAEKLYGDSVANSGAWNFGPNHDDNRSVEWLVRQICTRWGDRLLYQLNQEMNAPEATTLRLDCSKAKLLLGWSPKWNIDIAINKVLEWTKGYMDAADVKTLCLRQIEEYENWTIRI